MKRISVYGDFMQRLRKFAGHILRIASEALLYDEEAPKEALEEPQAPPPEELPKPRKAYNMAEHKTYYVIGNAILKVLADATGPKSVTQLVEMTGEGFAQSSVRQIAKELVRQGYLAQASEFPATFTLSQKLLSSIEEYQAALEALRPQGQT